MLNVGIRVISFNQFPVLSSQITMLSFSFVGDRHPFCGLAIKTVGSTDENGESGYHRVSGFGVWMHKCFGLQVFEHKNALLVFYSRTF